MKKRTFFLLLIVGMLVLSGLGAGITTTAKDASNKNNAYEKVTIELANPTFTDKNEFLKIDLEQSDTYLSKSGKPMLPVITKTFSYPIGTKIHDVSIDIEWDQYQLDKKVTPVPLILPLSVQIDPADLEEQKIDETVYESSKLYPSEAYAIKYGAGIEDMQHVIFVNVKCFPQYSPANDLINIPKTIDINVEYEAKEPAEETTAETSYDLIIITHDLFEDEFQRLVTHKEGLGISTKMVTVDEIYDAYDGVADWEEVKMYLADRVLTWDTKFVLLAGGHKGQTHDWYVPSFGSNNYDPSEEYDPPYDYPFAADLYFADVYTTDSSGNVFMEDWDTNGNGIYGEGPALGSGTDNPDFYPDVHLGRIPMRYEWEADVIVDKIINYENFADDSWFKTAVLAGGDGFPPERYGASADPNLWEGEIVCNVFADLLANKGIQSTKCYCSDEGDIKTDEASDVYNEVSKGCGFVHLTGHANPFSLGSYEPGTGISPEPPLVAFYTGYNAKEYDCGYKLPFMINEGCHNAQFDVTGQELIDSIFGSYPDFVFARNEWIPHDVSSWLLLQKDGGCIAIIGNTGLGLGGLNEGCTEFVGGWIMLRFAEAYAIDNKEYTGSVWTTGINGYIDNFDVMKDSGDRKTIEERALLGDPSLKLGGYGTGVLSADEPEENVEYGPVSFAAPTWTKGDKWTYALDNIDIDLSLTEDRGIILKLASGDIVLEVTDVKSNSYETQLTAENIDVGLGGFFDFHIPGVDDINIPTINLNNVNLQGILEIDKETLGINDIDLGLEVDLVENLDSLADALGMELPSFINLLTPLMTIPANINVKVDFENPLELVDFPLENGHYWGFPSNTVNVEISGSARSVWLRILSFVNNFVPIVPAEFAQYLPNIDIADILNDYGIETEYEFELDVSADLMSYHADATPLLEVVGSENINVEAGQFEAAKISIMDGNGHIYYSDSAKTIIKMTGYTSDYVPIISNLNIELKD